MGARIFGQLTAFTPGLVITVVLLMIRERSRFAQNWRQPVLDGRVQLVRVIPTLGEVENTLE
jgi:hypothetical protein